MTGYAIVLESARLERLQAVGNIAAIAAASEVPVDIFATMGGLEAFDKERIASMDYEMGEVGQAMMQAEGMEMAMFYENIAQAKELGPLSVYACELSMDMLGKTLDDYHEVFDDVLGVSGFLSHAEDKQVIFV
ncbi:hypothetical protein GJR96_00975 [Haloferax sp. MBLA0076]|uniref:Peroxiredoxin family protein n=1 Tax=Haloferax litoreum TaxID=2666140 RepID=A0A6A8GDC0_9EURY|nr:MULTISPECIES: hypothetical protein [Haloferax]KAB1192085.1 hypothetical protein Hfx1148_00975 [Haloferax sp. CBA1148]MRX20532.1 hypothetical protein [Haloferax litoreum]